MVNAAGAIGTAVALVVILAAKFLEGAWIIILAVPVLIAVFKSTHRHYQRLEAQVRATGR